jgi:predicted Zn-ribbon and HTH transcriptional regulator
MYRKDLFELPRATPRGIADIALPPEMEAKDVEADLHHPQRRLRRTRDRMVVTPAECRETRIRLLMAHIERTPDP